MAPARRTAVAVWASGQRENEGLCRYVGGCHWSRHQHRAEGLRHRWSWLQHHRRGVVLVIRGHAHPLTDLQDRRRVVRDSDDATVADAHTAVPAARAGLESEGEHELGHRTLIDGFDAPGEVGCGELPEQTDGLGLRIELEDGTAAPWDTVDVACTGGRHTKEEVKLYGGGISLPRRHSGGGKALRR